MQASAEQEFKGARPPRRPSRAPTSLPIFLLPVEEEILIVPQTSRFSVIKVIGRKLFVGRWTLGKLGGRHTRGPDTDLYLLAQPSVPGDLLLEKAPHRRNDLAEFRWRIHRQVIQRLATVPRAVQVRVELLGRS